MPKIKNNNLTVLSVLQAHRIVFWEFSKRHKLTMRKLFYLIAANDIESKHGYFTITSTVTGLNASAITYRQYMTINIDLCKAGLLRVEKKAKRTISKGNYITISAQYKLTEAGKMLLYEYNKLIINKINGLS
jgi:predicted transcriptional regulator